MISDTENESYGLGSIDSIEDAVKLGISFEDQGREFYLEFAQKTKDLAAKELFLYLADEEKKHSQYLMNYLDGEVLLFEGDSDVHNFKSAFSSEFTGGDLGEVGILLAAMRLERKTEDLYSMLARNASDSKQEEFFENLSSVERGHYDLIDGFLESATDFRMQT
ncbi:ferritin family protein [Methanococcoides sp. SA1]|nr:ferritin family protein [Methanococcoides sp. SA1]